MIGVILAAGKGSRISSKTEGIPKSFLEINDKKIIEHQIEALRFVGVDEIKIVVGYKSQMFFDQFANEKGITLIVNPFYEHCNVLGSLWMAKEHLNDDFLFMHADTIYDKEILSLLIKRDEDVVFAVEFKDTVEEEMKVIVKDDFVSTVNKTMNCSDAQGEFTGVAKVSKRSAPAIVERMRDIIENRKELNSFFEVAVQECIDQKDINVFAEDIGSFRSIEIDFPEDYQEALSRFN